MRAEEKIKPSWVERLREFLRQLFTVSTVGGILILSPLLSKSAIPEKEHQQVGAVIPEKAKVLWLNNVGLGRGQVEEANQQIEISDPD